MLYAFTGVYGGREGMRRRGQRCSWKLKPDAVSFLVWKWWSEDPLLSPIPAKL